MKCVFAHKCNKGVAFKRQAMTLYLLAK